MKSAIVTTTIFVPKLLSKYAADAKKYGHDPLFVVIGDKKTPQETADYCAALAKKSGFEVEYFSPERQETYLKKFPRLKEHLLWNSIQRRNVGILYAYAQGCESIITIDDDNFLVSEDFIGSHKVQGEVAIESVSSSSGWVNVCRQLKEKHGRMFYHRGFPLEKRLPSEKWRTKKAIVRPVVNAGLWLGDPDVDAMERLYHLGDPTDATRYVGKKNIALAEDAWSPFNSQNTALRKDAIPAYFLSPYIGRYDDIWAAYIIKRIADHLHDAIVFGKPIVRQERNPHNYWKDLDNERLGHALTLRFVEALRSITLKGKTYGECFETLTQELPAALHEQPMNDVEKAFSAKLVEGMRIWRETIAGV